MLHQKNDVMYAAIRYMGGEWCTTDKEVLKKVRDKLVEVKEKWIAMDYGTIEKFASRDYAAAYYWNAAAMRAREKIPMYVSATQKKASHFLWIVSPLSKMLKTLKMPSYS